MTTWIVILAVGIGSFLLRLSLIGSNRIRLPARLDAASQLVAPAAFATLAVSGIAGEVLSGGFPQGLSVLAAVGVGALATVRTGSPAAAMIAGLPTYWLMAAVLPG